MPVVWRLLNKEWTKFSAPGKEETMLIKEALNGARIELLFSSHNDKFMVYCDEEYMSNGKEQNESIAYLLAGIEPGFNGLIYGPVAIVTQYPQMERRMRIWLDRLDNGYLDQVLESEDDLDRMLQDLWLLPEGEYEKKYSEMCPICMERPKGSFDTCESCTKDVEL